MSQVFSNLRRQFSQQLTRMLGLHLLCQSNPQAKFCVVFEQRIGPGDTTAIAVHRVWRSRQVAAVDGGAASSVGYDRAVAKQLGHQLDVGSLTTTRTGAGEFKQR